VRRGWGWVWEPHRQNIFSLIFKVTRTLATANRSRVSIRGQPCKNCLKSSLITMQNLVVVPLYCVRACRRTQNFWGWGPAPLDGGVADALETQSNRLGLRIVEIVETLTGRCNTLRLHMCYCVKFRRCMSSRFGVDRGPINFVKFFHPLYLSPPVSLNSQTQIILNNNTSLVTV